MNSNQQISLKAGQNGSAGFTPPPLQTTPYPGSRFLEAQENSLEEATPNTHEGQYIARLMLAQLGSTEHPDNNESVRTIHAALLELIDVPLNWNNHEATVERLAGFAQGLADGLVFRIPPELPSEDLDRPQGVPCITCEGGSSHA